MDKKARIYVAGHKGLVGSALCRRLTELGFKNILKKTHQELDLVDANQTAAFFKQEKPEYVFMAAAKVGGIQANKTQPADFIYNNLQIQTNIIHQSWLNKVKKLIYFGSSCMYPKYAEQPIKEKSLFRGTLEETNEAYAIAKLMGFKMCHSYNRQHGTNFVVVIPTNLYGFNDNFDPDTGHVISSLITRFHEAKQNNQSKVTLWGTGSPKREFMNADDLATACITIMDHYKDIGPINIGSGEVVTIKDLAEKIKTIVGFKGSLEFDITKPDGMPFKSLHSQLMEDIPWEPKIKLDEGLKLVYDWFIKQKK